MTAPCAAFRTAAPIAAPLWCPTTGAEQCSLPAPYGDIAASGRSITMAGIAILRLKDGRIVAASSMWHWLSVFQQLGVLTIGTQPAP